MKRPGAASVKPVVPKNTGLYQPPADIKATVGAIDEIGRRARLMTEAMKQGIGWRELGMSEDRVPASPFGSRVEDRVPSPDPICPRCGVNTRRSVSDLCDVCWEAEYKNTGYRPDDRMTRDLLPRVPTPAPKSAPPPIAKEYIRAELVEPMVPTPAPKSAPPPIAKVAGKRKYEL